MTLNQENPENNSETRTETGTETDPLDLLPGDDDDDQFWQDTSPQSQGYITDQNFLESRYNLDNLRIGFGSGSRSRRQLRVDAPIPKVHITPWLFPLGSGGKINFPPASDSQLGPTGDRKGFEIEA